MPMEDLIDQIIYENVCSCIYIPFDAKKVLQLLEQVMLGNTKEPIQERN